MEYIENRTFDEIQIGDSASLVRTLNSAEPGPRLSPGDEGEPMGFHETEHGMTHEDIVPLVDRVATHLTTARGVSRDQAGILAHKMLHELTGDVRNDFEAFVAQAAPAEAAQRRIAYWTEEQHWQGIDPDVAQTLRAAKATRQEIEVLVMG